MKIKNIACEQFAGIRDKNVSFDDGINIVYGKNESGKSTLVNLLARTLFQNARLDGRSDKEFYDLYFPGERKDGAPVGDFVDGRVTFETENGTYTVKKEWGVDPRCTLSAPNGSIREQNKIDEILRNELGYGEGVYVDILLSSQKNTDIALQTILDASKKTDAKQEIANAVTVAFAESDGISMDAIEQSITAKIEALVGKHWDEERDRPKSKSGRWTNKLGEILEAYYKLEDAKIVLEEISRLENEADTTVTEYATKNQEAEAAEEEFNKFNAYASNLILQNERKDKVKKLELELERYRKILDEWPKTADELEKSKALQRELSNREIIDKYDAAEKINTELENLKKGQLKECPSKQEIDLVKKGLNNIRVSENKLCGMNLAARIKMLGGNDIIVKSVRTGEPIDVSKEDVNITEAVQIEIPNVMEMQLSPANVDVEIIGKEIEKSKANVAEICGKYGVESLEELEEMAKVFAETQQKIDMCSKRLEIALGGNELETLKSAVKEIVEDVREKAEIEKDIMANCGNSDINRFVTAKETIVEGYEKEYTSVDCLKAKAFDADTEIRKAKGALGAVEDVPQEYSEISDPEAYLEALQETMKNKQKSREEALTRKTAVSSKLESYKEGLTTEPKEEVEKAERNLKEQKELYAHWKHIYKVFKELKENISDNPLEDISANFTRNLQIISEGKITSEFLEEDKINMNIYSSDKLLDYGKLSEGTKETVSLAFRLAVLDHLFPEGGGVIVLDDPFTDMDAERVAQSCNLVKESAKRHQVIFLTCREEYIDMLAGNVIYC